MGGIYSSVKGFLKEPFTTPMSFWQYSSLVGITIVIVIMWLFILREVETLGKEI